MRILIHVLLGWALLSVLTGCTTVSTEEKVVPDSSVRGHDVATIPSGTYKPFFAGKNDLKEVELASFFINKRPVTNAQYLEFIKANPTWRKSKRVPLFADELYLSNWSDDLSPPDGGNERPVTFVSWFGAKGYCAWKKMRLPTVSEWEFVGLAGITEPDGRQNPQFVKELLAAYSKPSAPVLPDVGNSTPNFYGVYDMHGIIWEWTSDFNSMLVTGESRGDSAIERELYCGSGSANVSDAAKINYPAFLRSGFRSSLQGNYCIHNLGFRCAAD